MTERDVIITVREQSHRWILPFGQKTLVCWKIEKRDFNSPSQRRRVRFRSPLKE